MNHKLISCRCCRCTGSHHTLASAGCRLNSLPQVTNGTRLGFFCRELLWGDKKWWAFVVNLPSREGSHIPPGEVGKSKIIFKMDFSGDMLVPRRVSVPKIYLRDWLANPLGMSSCVLSLEIIGIRESVLE